MMKNFYLLALTLIALQDQVQFTTVAVISIKDVHGTALPTSLEKQFPQKQAYTYGGLFLLLHSIYIFFIIFTVSSAGVRHKLKVH